MFQPFQTSLSLNAKQKNSIQPCLSNSDKMSKNPVSGLLRLNSLEGECHMLQSDKTAIESSPTTEEFQSKWFNHSSALPSTKPSCEMSTFRQSFYESGPFCEQLLSHPSQQQFQSPVDSWTDPFSYAMCPTQQDISDYILPAQRLGHGTMAMVGNVFQYVLESIGIHSGGRVSLDTVKHSKLNPNAKVFTPQLNPNAKEFTPGKSPACSFSPLPANVQESPPVSPEIIGADLVDAEPDRSNEVDDDVVTSDIGSVSECETPVQEMELKSVEAHLCTPFLPKPASTHEQEEETEDEIIRCDDDSASESGESQLSDEEDLEEDEEPLDDSRRRFCARQRSLSSCSDESFIEFTASSPGETPVVNCDRIVTMFIIEAADSDDESEVEALGEEGTDTEDWDEVDRTEDKDFNETFTNLGFSCPWFLPDLKTQSSSTQKSSRRMSIENLKCDEKAPPSCRPANNVDLEKRIHDANALWKKHYESPGSFSQVSTLTKRASFAPKESWTEIFEDPRLADDLRKSRMSDSAQRRADHERMERLLAPVFAAEHRQKVWDRMHASNL